MNTPKYLVVAAFLISSAGLSIAGPGPQYWHQQSQNAAAQKKAGQTVSSNHPAAKDTATAQTNGCKGCSSCSAHS